MLYSWIACHVNEWAGYHSVTCLPQHFIWWCSWVPQQWRRDGISLPGRGDDVGFTLSVISLLTVLVIYTVSVCLFPFSICTPSSLFSSPWSVGMMDRCIHKGEGGNHSEVEDESEEGGSRIEREGERMGKWRGGWEDIKFTEGSAGLLHIRSYDVFLENRPWLQNDSSS